ncbi:GNAT family N-acetyltransferase [Galbitalea soli]|uniref:N-acetyltransferase n=1 Tax=Galbitalea soli TaxID=1268042 RepID=A0A7C9TNQ5_9MICO|nr:GNAT family N-acetyltransferase [Galbitalea soli]NEM90336.1 N-acetyltransferase [Galbitalea soli]NYJ31045.1 hypothetical protein [Galbitalea soli]
MTEFRKSDRRYEIVEEGAVIGASYFRDAGERRVFTHTEIDAEWGGRGLATQLVRYALDDTRVAGMRVVAQCPMVAAFITKNPDYADLLDRPAGVDG